MTNLVGQVSVSGSLNGAVWSDKTLWGSFLWGQSGAPQTDVDSPSGVLGVGGTVREAWAQALYLTPTLLVTGTAVESWTLGVQRLTGSMTASGSNTERSTFVDRTSGVLLLGTVSAASQTEYVDLP